MNQPPNPDRNRPDANAQRDELLRNEGRAQPENFKPEAVDDKVVEFEPGGPEGVAPIQGLDPDEPGSGERSRGGERPRGDKPA
jgi:hypothetical protein